METLDENSTVEQLRMRAKGLYNLLLARRPTTDLGGTSGKNSLDGLVKPAQELIK